MAKVTSFEDGFYRPPLFHGLEELVRFPDGEIRRGSIPNSTVWVFGSNGHEFIPMIHAGDIGCGMAAFVISEVDVKESTDIIYDYLQVRNVIGRGNHFVDICSGITSSDPKSEGILSIDHNILVVHTHGPDNTVPNTITQAQRMQESSSQYRVNVGHELADRIGTSASLLGDWPHNTVEQIGGKIIYRKGVVKVQPEKVHILPAHLGARILLYTVDGGKMPPYSSMPHATGRSGPRGETKVSPEVASELRDLVYIPAGISDASLRSEHPSCYNDFNKIFEKMRDYTIIVGEMKIEGYVGKT